MSFFSKILEKLGIGKQEEEVKPVEPVKAAPLPAVKKVVPVAAAPKVVKPAPRPGRVDPFTAKDDTLTRAVPKAPAVVPMSKEDVVAKLDRLAKENPNKLDWKVSIVDLLKLLDLDSSLKSRKELAVELGCPEEMMGGDHVKMNVWLHKAVLQKIAENGGNIPASMLD
ncbi:MAG TPA: DUF3597 family protein [Anaerolineales bacterium]|nr:DUF3597 family protein [Anaerolineales bacterium]